MTFVTDCAKLLFFFQTKLMRDKRKILRFVPHILRKSFANENPNQKYQLKTFKNCNI